MNGLSSNTVLVGSTPGDAVIKSMLSIDPGKQVDFIRWHLTLGRGDAKAYTLNINFGEAKPNTSGFKSNGENLSIQGTYTVSKSKIGDICELKNAKAKTLISLVKLNENLYHVLAPDNKLMVGNGGWSYTLNRQDPLPNNSVAVPSLTTLLPAVSAQDVIFDGRTPCLDLARQYNIPVENDCFKLKWKLTLHRDPTTKAPTIYTLQSTLHRSTAIEGKWAILKGLSTNPDAVVYRLDPDKPREAMSLLVGDENVLFFLDKENRLFTGNGDFSFTLNRRPQ